MNRPTLIDLSPIECNYFPFMINLDKCNGIVMLLMTYLQKYVFRVKKDVNVKVFIMIIRIIDAKTQLKHISCDCKWKFDSATYNSNHKWNIDKCQCEFKKCDKCKKDYSWNSSPCVCENSKYLKNNVDDSVVEIISTTEYEQYGKYFINKFHEYCVNKF